ncbi:MAG: 1-(5-phosphoribosyl)-5-[(5-phosphoribosylamino)methylideneamino]imidazole-4-carboxamide isomerase [Acidimicrobiales bacterium]
MSGLTVDVWPAIDIRGGRCVRLRRGDFAEETEYGDPVEVALRYLQEGAERLHVVDLDAARTGEAVNRPAICEIAFRTGLLVQAGGGVRDETAASALLDSGIERVVIGTSALRDGRGFLCRLIDRWPGRIVVGLDYRVETGDRSLREVAVRGWTEASGTSLAEAVAAMADLELAGLVVTDISRDGTGMGPDLATYAELLEATELPLIASGGVGSVDDITSLRALGPKGRRLAGVIVGKALLGGSVTIEQSRRAASGAET